MDTDTVYVGLRVPADLIDYIDRYRSTAPYQPTRSAIIRQILSDWADNRKKRRVTPDHRE
jgi:hypothetical protein